MFNSWFNSGASFFSGLTSVPNRLYEALPTVNSVSDSIQKVYSELPTADSLTSQLFQLLSCSDCCGYDPASKDTELVVEVKLPELTPDQLETIRLDLSTWNPVNYIRLTGIFSFDGIGRFFTSPTDDNTSDTDEVLDNKFARLLENSEKLKNLKSALTEIMSPHQNIIDNFFSDQACLTTQNLFSDYYSAKTSKAFNLYGSEFLYLFVSLNFSIPDMIRFISVIQSLSKDDETKRVSIEKTGALLNLATSISKRLNENNEERDMVFNIVMTIFEAIKKNINIIPRLIRYACVLIESDQWDYIKLGFSSTGQTDTTINELIAFLNHMCDAVEIKLPQTV